MAKLLPAFFAVAVMAPTFDCVMLSGCEDKQSALLDVIETLLLDYPEGDPILSALLEKAKGLKESHAFRVDILVGDETYTFLFASSISGGASKTFSEKYWDRSRSRELSYEPA